MGTQNRGEENQIGPVRIPPLTSPGLLVPQYNHISASVAGNASGTNAPNSSAISSGAATAQGKTNSKEGMTAPDDIFKHHMGAAGYTKEARAQRPHRGSSTERHIGDMYDSNVKLRLHFPPLVPPDLLLPLPASSENQGGESSSANSPQEPTTSSEAVADSKQQDQEASTLPSILIAALKKAVRKRTAQNEKEEANDGTDVVQRKRPRYSTWNIRDFLPLSLTTPYPESYIEKRLQYVKLVQERERAIVARQETEEENEMRAETEIVPLPTIPPIPEPPSPPVMKEVNGFLSSGVYEDCHPFYPPLMSDGGTGVGNESFVAHLDKKCFHIADGRYFGLWTNRIADPNFVGANAPGISGVSVSGGGLATATAAGSNTVTGVASLSISMSASSSSNTGSSSLLPKAGDPSAGGRLGIEERRSVVNQQR